MSLCFLASASPRRPVLPRDMQRASVVQLVVRVSSYVVDCFNVVPPTQVWEGKVKKYFFESPLVRLLKQFGYKDVYEEGSDRVVGGPEADAQRTNVPYRSIVIYRYYEPSSEDLGTGEKPDMKRFASGLG